MKKLLALTLLLPRMAFGAIDFNGSTGIASAASAEVTGVPLSFACLVNSDSATAGQVAFAVDDFNEVSSDSFRLQLRGPVGGDPASAVTVTAGTQTQADTSTGYSTGTWHSVVVVFASTTSRAAYIDGASKGTDATSSVPTGIDATEMGGVTINSVGSSFFDGKVAECGVWSTTLSDDDAAALGRFFAPPCVQRASLVAYYPTIRDATSLKDLFSATANNLTLAGTTAVADHPRVINCQ